MLHYCYWKLLDFYNFKLYMQFCNSIDVLCTPYYNRTFVCTIAVDNFYMQYYNQCVLYALLWLTTFRFNIAIDNFRMHYCSWCILKKGDWAVPQSTNFLGLMWLFLGWVECGPKTFLGNTHIDLIVSSILSPLYLSGGGIKRKENRIEKKVI